MKIVIEAQRIFRENKHGMDFVALETIRCLQSLDTHNEYYIIVAPGPDQCLRSNANFHVITLRCPSYPLWEQVALPMAIARIKPDVVHCTSNTAPIWCPAPLVLTLHDIIFLEKQTARNSSIYQQFGRIYRRLVVPRILNKCRKIITVSEFECNRIRTSLNLAPEKIMAIHNGYSKRFKPLKDFRRTVDRYIENDKYIFFLGNTDPKKNAINTLRGYSEYVRRSENPMHLMIADMNRKSIDAIIEQQGLKNISNLVDAVGYIPHSDLAAIYNGAHTFLYTSLRESFGIPILEAMACGTPIVTSRTSAIPEIAGSGAILVDPTDTMAIASRLIWLEERPEYYAAQREYGLERVKEFSWEKTAKQLLTLYESIGERKRK